MYYIIYLTFIIADLKCINIFFLFFLSQLNEPVEWANPVLVISWQACKVCKDLRRLIQMKWAIFVQNDWQISNISQLPNTQNENSPNCSYPLFEFLFILWKKKKFLIIKSHKIMTNFDQTQQFLLNPTQSFLSNDKVNNLHLICRSK